MDFNLISNIESCYITVPHLLYYSHIPTAIIALFLGFFIFFKNRNGNSLTSRILLFTSLFFFLWSMIDLYLWVGIDSRKIIFFWSLINLLEMLVSSSTLYFAYVFLSKKNVPLKYTTVIGALLIIFIVLIPTKLNLPGFDLFNCEAEQGFLIYYFYFLEILFSLCLVAYLIRKILTAKGEERGMVIYFSIGVICFLASFSGANVVASITERWEILQYGLFGMPFFMAFLVYLIVKYQAFNIKLLAAQALIIGLILLIASQYFFIRTPINRVLTGITLFFAATFGWWLARSVKREVRQREELAVANAELQKLDQAKTLFLNIASHQLRTPLSGIKGFLAMILDGDFGEVPAKIKKILSELYANNNRLVRLVNTLLNVSRMESGRLSLLKAECDVVSMANHIVNELQFEAKDRGLTLSLETSHPKIIANLDVDKIEDAFVNMIDNGIKYTKKGAVKARVLDQTDKVRFEVEDTGQGLKQSEIKTLFNKFVRGDRATQLHTDGSGIGLYLAKQIVDLHNGTIGVNSLGINKGSTFWFEVPR